MKQSDRPSAPAPPASAGATLLSDPYATSAADAAPAPANAEEAIARSVESAVVRAVFRGDELTRRRFVQALGAAGAAALLRQLFPIEAAQAMALETKGPIEIMLSSPVVSAANPTRNAHAHGRT